MDQHRGDDEQSSSSKRGSTISGVVTGAMSSSGIAQVGLMRRTFRRGLRPISTPIVALPAVLMFTQAKVPPVNASVGTAMMWVGRWLRDRRGKGEEEVRLKGGGTTTARPCVSTKLLIVMHVRSATDQRRILANGATEVVSRGSAARIGPAKPGLRTEVGWGGVRQEAVERSRHYS